MRAAQLQPPLRAADLCCHHRCRWAAYLQPVPAAAIATRSLRVVTSAAGTGGGGSGADGPGDRGGAASGGGGTHPGPLGGGSLYDDYGSYGYVYDLDSQPPGHGGRGRSLAAVAAQLESLEDMNALQTALAVAIQSEDYELAAAVRDRLRAVAGGGGRIDWAAAGVPHWLADRAQRLGFRFPTEIQRRSAPVLLAGSDAVVASETGSGKTLSFLVPMLARLTYPPDIFPEDMKGPQALVVVPTLELGAQVALAAFRLLGGNVGAGAGRPGDPANMFTYRGPRGVKVRGVLNKEEVVMAKSSLTYTAGVSLLVATPSALAEAVRGPQPQPQLVGQLKVLAVDEVDECFAASPRDMELIMSLATQGAQAAGAGAGQAGQAVDEVAAAEGRKDSWSGGKPQVIFVGATQRQDVLQTAVERGWLREPVNIQMGREGTVPAALSHRYVVVPGPRRLAALVRCLRADLAAADQDSAPARVMLFANSPAEAAAVAEPLRSSLWADHRIAVLLPPGTLLGPNADSEEPPSLSAPSSASSKPSRGRSPSRGLRPPAAAPTWPPSAAGSTSSSPSPGGSDVKGSPGGGGGRARASGGAPSPAPAPGSGGASGAGSAALDDLFAYNPIRALHSFRDNHSTLLLASGAAARGLDLPGVSHVYNLGPPPDATQYLHRAGRAGRIGCMAGGVVTTLVTPEELPALLEVGRQLGIRLEADEGTATDGELVSGGLPRLQAPPDDDAGGEQDGEEGQGRDGEDAAPDVRGAEGGGGGQDESGGAGGLRGRRRGRRGQGAGGSAGGELGDVERLRRGLEDLFNLM